MNQVQNLTFTKGQARVLDILADGAWHGLEDFIEGYAPEYRKRISELRAAGVLIEDRMRTRRNFKGDALYRAKDYRLVAGQ